MKKLMISDLRISENDCQDAYEIIEMYSDILKSKIKLAEFLNAPILNSLKEELESMYDRDTADVFYELIGVEI